VHVVGFYYTNISQCTVLWIKFTMYVGRKVQIQCKIRTAVLGGGEIFSDLNSHVNCCNVLKLLCLYPQSPAPDRTMVSSRKAYSEGVHFLRTTTTQTEMYTQICLPQYLLIRVSSPYNKYAHHIQPEGCGILSAVILRQTIQYCALYKGKIVHDTWLIN
jgi:hypothetical protein